MIYKIFISNGILLDAIIDFFLVIAMEKNVTKRIQATYKRDGE
jgi:hypothetical protein